MKARRIPNNSNSNGNGYYVTARDGFAFTVGVLVTLCALQYLDSSDHL